LTASPHADALVWTVHERGARDTAGLTIHGQLFRAHDGRAHHPALIFVHGGPERQMLTTFHYFEAYSMRCTNTRYTRMNSTASPAPPIFSRYALANSEMRMMSINERHRAGA
jgi:hypothetical protein